MQFLSIISIYFSNLSWRKNSKVVMKANLIQSNTDFLSDLQKLSLFSKIHQPFVNLHPSKGSLHFTISLKCDKLVFLFRGPLLGCKCIKIYSMHKNYFGSQELV